MKQIDTARCLTQDRQFEEALEIFSGMLAQYVLRGDQEARLYHERGLVYLQKDSLDEAQDNFSRAVKLDDSLASAYAMLGQIAFRRQNYVQAESFYTKALARQSPGPSSWYLSRVLIYLELGKLKDASSDLAHVQQDALDSPEGLALQAQLALAENDARKAERLLVRAVEMNPDHLGALLLYANVLKESNQFEESRRRASQVLERQPGHVKALQIRSYCLLRLHRNREAVEDFSILISGDPSRASFYADRSLAFLREKDYAAALADCNRALELNPDLGPVHYRKGHIFHQLGKYGPAHAGYTRAIQINGLDPEIWLARGVLNDQFEYDLAALEDYTRSLERKPDQAIALCFRGRIFLAQNKFIQAQEDCARALALRPDMGFAWYLQGRLHDRMGESNQALLCYKKALELGVGGQAKLRRAAVREKTGDWSGASEDYEALLGVESFEDQARVRLADLFLKSKEWEKAFKMINGTPAESDDRVEGLWIRAQAAHGLGKFQEALEDIEEMLKRDQGSTDILCLRGDILLNLNRPEMALASYQQSLELFPGNADAWLGKALCESRKQQPSEALESYRNAIRLHSNRTEAYLGLASILREQIHHMSDPNKSAGAPRSPYSESQLERRERIDRLLLLYAEAEQKAGASTELYLHRAEFLASIGRWGEAEKDAHRCLQMAPAHARAKALLNSLKSE